MSEEPPNPFYMYDNADKEYLEENLRKITFEWSSYKNWTERAEKEIQYIKKKLEEKNA